MTGPALAATADAATADPATADTGTRQARGSQRIEAVFGVARGDRRLAFVPYIVAGYPDAATSERAALAAIDAGADLLEVGLPYSDPVADGATLQRAGSAALAAGATLASSLALVERVADSRPGTPLLVMGYVNQFLGPPAASVAARLASAGASGAIVPDLTPDEGGPLEAAFLEHRLALVYLVAPTTPTERASTIAARSGGFVYGVSLLGVTGARRALPPDLRSFIGRVKGVSPLPVAIGFGVSRPAHVRAVGRAGADGVVVGSALVNALGVDGRDVDALARLCGTLRQATALAGDGDERYQSAPAVRPPD